MIIIFLDVVHFHISIKSSQGETFAGYMEPLVQTKTMTEEIVKANMQSALWLQIKDRIVLNGYF